MNVLGDLGLAFKDDGYHSPPPPHGFAHIPPPVTDGELEYMIAVSALTLRLCLNCVSLSVCVCVCVRVCAGDGQSAARNQGVCANQVQIRCHSRGTRNSVWRTQSRNGRQRVFPGRSWCVFVCDARVDCVLCGLFRVRAVPPNRCRQAERGRRGCGPTRTGSRQSGRILQIQAKHVETARKTRGRGLRAVWRC